MKLKSYFTAALFVFLTLGLATSCKEKDPVKEIFSLSKGEVKIGLRQTIRVKIIGNSTYQTTPSSEGIVDVKVNNTNIFITALDKTGEVVVTVKDAQNTKYTKNIKVTVQENLVTVRDTAVINASASDKWVYFSFLNGNIIAINKNGTTDIPSGNDWDIAFCRFYSRTNSGKSNSDNNGKGGAFMTDAKSLDELTKIPDENSFVIDRLDTIMPQMKIVKTATNKELNKWIDVNISQMPPKTTLNKTNVFVVRCADGKTFAKIKFLDYKNDENQKYYPKFEYEYPFVGK